ncbi:MAG: YidC/Oxa1 family membrane protein insertase, partial [Nanoarchaeota archaeon]
MPAIWNAVLYKPLMNALAFLVAIVPGGDVGIAVIILTVIVKRILFPLSQKSIESQAAMSLLAPELNKIKNRGLSKEEQARLTFELYKKNKTNPFSGCLLVLIQIPIIFALYYVFLRGGLPEIHPELLYSFVDIPKEVSMKLLGFLDITQKNIYLAVFAGLTQFLQ